jgi:hypothetical protein
VKQNAGLAPGGVQIVISQSTAYRDVVVTPVQHAAHVWLTGLILGLSSQTEASQKHRKQNITDNSSALPAGSDQ